MHWMVIAALALAGGVLVAGALFGVFFYVDFFLAARFPKLALGGRVESSAGKTTESKTPHK